MDAQVLPAPRARTSLLRAILAGGVGNALEWFDYALYGFFGTVISANFFPREDPLAGLVLTFMVFGLGFVARPVGGFIFGHLGDRLGRKRVLAMTVILMGVSTMGMGLLPSYARLGVLAPIVLTLLRLCQGMAAGGEWGSCVSFLTEYAKPHNRGFIVSWSQVSSAIGLMIGALLGTLLSSSMSHDALYEWGWRIAFWFGIVVAIVGYTIRRTIAETPIFQETAAKDSLSKSPLRDCLRGYKKELVTVFFLVGGGNVAYWLILNYMSTYMTQFLKLSMTTGFSLNSWILLVYMVALPICGWFTDQIGRKWMMIIGGGGVTFLSYPLFQLLAHASGFGEMAAIVAVLSIFFAAFITGLTVGVSEIFPTAVRCSGFAIAYQMATAVFGGTVMFTVTWLYRATGNVMSMPIYMSSVMFLSFLAAVFLFPETKGKPLR
jgi:MHS family proline/betaine transporter-like MFS transporter